MPQAEQSPPHAPSVAEVRVRSLGTSAADTGSWQNYVARAEGATIYHDISWRTIFEAAFAYPAHMLVAEDAGGIRGALPLFRVPGLFSRGRLVSVPFRDRGGVLYDTPAAFCALVAFANALCREEECAHIVLKSLAQYPETLAQSAGLSRRDQWVHSQADLSTMTPDRLMHALGDKTRNMVRQGERAGLRFAEEASLDDWLILHRAAQHGLGVPAFPRVLFEKIFATLGAEGKARLFLVRDARGRAMAATIGYVEKDRFIYAYSASSLEGREVRANDVMLSSLLQWAMAKGLRYFDFGSDSPLQAGLLFFKRKWLAQQSPIPIYQCGEGGFPDSSDSRYGAVRAAVRWLPAAPIRLLLSPMIRYLG